MNKLRVIIVNVCRLILAITFIISGYVKAIDPLGTQYKITDYLAAIDLAGMVPQWTTLLLAVVLAAIEFALGVFMLFAIKRQTTTRLTLAFMAVMTLITVWIYIADPVKDCGCFGDAFILTNGETLLKNILLVACAAIVADRKSVV